MKTLILGLGNPILSDDGVGLCVARALKSLVAPDITVMEDSLAGLDFLDVLAGYKRVIIVDAIQTKAGRVGQIYRLKPETFATTRHAANPHDVNLATALEHGKQLGLALPDQIIIFGIEVEDVTTFSEDCTPAVKAAIPDCVNMVMNELNAKDEVLRAFHPSKPDHSIDLTRPLPL